MHTWVEMPQVVFIWHMRKDFVWFIIICNKRIWNEAFHYEQASVQDGRVVHSADMNANICLTSAGL